MAGIEQDYKLKQVDECSSRERACTILRRRAREHHDFAAQLEILADFAECATPPADEALWRVVMDFRPR